MDVSIDANNFFRAPLNWIFNS